MRKQRLFGALGLVGLTSGLAFAVACGSSSSGDDSAANGDDGSSGTDSTSLTQNDSSTKKDSSSTSDAAQDAGAPDACTSSPCVTQIAVAGDDTCALLSDKTVRCWGQNLFGQLGVGTDVLDGSFDGAPYSVPVAVPGRTAIDEVATGDYFAENMWACARSGNTNLQCWGSNHYAQLGLGDAATTDNLPHPNGAPIMGLPSATQFSLAGGHSCALQPSGKIECWGDNVDFGLGREVLDDAGDSIQYLPTADFVDGGGNDYTHVVSGEAQTCALTQTGGVDCWGWNSYGQLGRADAGYAELEPHSVDNLSEVTQLVGGQDFYCALTSSGAVMCWGQNSLGQLGEADASASTGLVAPVVLPAGRKATLIGAGQQTGCALLDDATLWCWGDNTAGELGSDLDAATSSSTAQQVPITGKITQIAGGRAHMCVLLEGGSMQCWGSNVSGELGRGVGDGGLPDSVAHPNPAPVTF